MSARYTTPRSERKTKGIEIMLCKEAQEELVRRAEKEGISRSKVVERWLLRGKGKRDG